MNPETIQADSRVLPPVGVRLGSLACALVSGPQHYCRMLASAFGTDLVPLAELSERPEVEISIRESAIPFTAPPTDRLTISRTERGRRLETDPLTCDVHLDRTPRIEFVVRQPDMADVRLAYHFWILTHRWLLLLDRVVLHAAAILLGESVLLFCAPKGAGKSTLSVSLAAAGAVILAEDHVMVRRSGEELLVSGCSGRMRVTRQTEQHFLPGLLPADAVDVPGCKKEFQGHHLFATRPYVDFRPHRLFFNRVGTAYGVRPLSKKEALLGLIRHTSELYRFGGPHDYGEFLALLSDLSVQVPAFDLELSDRLEDLDHLAQRLW
jgi:hypothetical protein